MTPDRWRQLSRIYHAALARAEIERADFLRDECGGDSDLRRHVESLLAQPASAAEHLSQLEPSGPIGPGTALGPYTIVDLVGTGGMGQVYRARDTRVDRDVAVKVLPAGLAHDHDRQQRFAREARVTASLTHPHICTLYEFERSTTTSGEPIDFLVMEFVEGPTLEEVIAGAATAGGETPAKPTLTEARD